MTEKQFIEKYCHSCGTQRCEGPGTEWFEGCSKRWNLEGMDSAAEIERLNKSITDLSSKVVREYIKIPETGIGWLSDGYHTFNELYHHRAVLFSVICNTFPEKAWKSKKHHEGDMFEGMFIVGIETPNGQATYHYDIEPYWDMFKVKELDTAPWWDGHSANDAIARIGTLTNDNRSEWVFEGKPIHCKECGFTPNYSLNKENSKFCPGCGKEMK